MTPVLPCCSALSEPASTRRGSAPRDAASPPLGRTPVGGGSITREGRKGKGAPRQSGSRTRGRRAVARGGGKEGRSARASPRGALWARTDLGRGAAEGAGRSGRRRRSVLARRGGAAGRGPGDGRWRSGLVRARRDLCRSLRAAAEHRRTQVAAAGRSSRRLYPASAGPSPATTDVEEEEAAAGGAGPGPEGRESSRRGGACPAAR